MFKLFMVFLFSAAIPLFSFADDTLTVFASCEGGKDLSSTGASKGAKPMTAEDLVKTFKTDGMKSTTIDSKVVCGGKIDMMGMTGPFQTSNFTKMTFSTSDLYYFSQKQELLFKNGKRSTPAPSSVSDLLKEFSMYTAGNCDFLVPSRFSIVKMKDLKPQSTTRSTESQGAK